MSVLSVASVNVVLLIGQPRGEFSGPFLDKPDWLVPFAFSGVVVIGSLFSVWVWRRLWRKGRDQWESIVYDFGVRLGGAAAAAWIAIAIALRVAQDLAFGVFFLPVSFFLGAVCFGVPLGFCFGYYWGMRFASYKGVVRSAGLVDADLPTVGA